MKALADTVLLKLLRPSNKSAGGIILNTHTGNRREGDASQMAMVMALGEVAFENLKVKPQVGDVITFPKYAGSNVDGIGCDDLRVIHDTAAWLIIDKEDLEGIKFETEDGQEVEASKIVATK